MINSGKSKKLVIFGYGQLAQLSHFYFTHDSDYEVVAFTVDEAHLKEDNYLGLPCVPYEKLSEIYPSSSFYVFIAVGYSKLNSIRTTKYLSAKKMGYSLASYISSKAQFWPEDLSVGENVMIMEGNCIMPFCKIEDNVHIWIGNILSHHSIIRKHTTITSHVALGGGVNVGERCFIGLNATIRDNIVIADGSIIAASANVIKSTEPDHVYMGNPAIKTGTKDDVKL